MDDPTAILLDITLACTITSLAMIVCWLSQTPRTWGLAIALLGFGMPVPLMWVRMFSDERNPHLYVMVGFALMYLLGIGPLVMHARTSGIWMMVAWCVAYIAMGFVPLIYMLICLWLKKSPTDEMPVGISSGSISRDDTKSPS
jgi:hypothetical protein